MATDFLKGLHCSLIYEKFKLQKKSPLRNQINEFEFWRNMNSKILILEKEKKKKRINQKFINAATKFYMNKDSSPLFLIFITTVHFLNIAFY